MSIFLGNIQFHQVREFTGFQLTEDDKKTWDEFNNPNADLSGKESSFHFFHIPTCIVLRGEPAKEAILKMFTSDKQVEHIAEIQVFEK